MTSNQAEDVLGQAKLMFEVLLKKLERSADEQTCRYVAERAQATLDAVESFRQLPDERAAVRTEREQLESEQAVLRAKQEQLQTEQAVLRADRERMQVENATRQSLGRQVVEDVQRSVQEAVQRSVQEAVQAAMQKHAEAVAAAVAGLKEDVAASEDETRRRIDAGHARLAERLASIEGRQTKVVDRVDGLVSRQAGIRDDLVRLCERRDDVSGRMHDMADHRLAPLAEKVVSLSEEQPSIISAVKDIGERLTAVKAAVERVEDACASLQSSGSDLLRSSVSDLVSGHVTARGALDGVKDSVAALDTACKEAREHTANAIQGQSTVLGAIEGTQTAVDQAAALVRSLDGQVRTLLGRNDDGQRAADVARIGRSVQAQVVAALAEDTTRATEQTLEASEAGARRHAGKLPVQEKKRRGDAGDAVEPGDPRATKRQRVSPLSALEPATSPESDWTESDWTESDWTETNSAAAVSPEPSPSPEDDWTAAIDHLSRWLVALRPEQVSGDDFFLQDLLEVALGGYVRDGWRVVARFIERDKHELQGKWLCWLAICDVDSGRPADLAHRQCIEGGHECMEVMPTASGGYRYRRRP